MEQASTLINERALASMAEFRAMAQGMACDTVEHAGSVRTGTDGGVWGMADDAFLLETASLERVLRQWADALAELRHAIVKRRKAGGGQ